MLREYAQCKALGVLTNGTGKCCILPRIWKVSTVWWMLNWFLLSITGFYTGRFLRLASTAATSFLEIVSTSLPTWLCDSVKFFKTDTQVIVYRRWPKTYNSVRQYPSLSNYFEFILMKQKPCQSRHFQSDMRPSKDIIWPYEKVSYTAFSHFWFAPFQWWHYVLWLVPDYEVREQYLVPASEHFALNSALLLNASLCRSWIIWCLTETNVSEASPKENKLIQTGAAQPSKVYVTCHCLCQITKKFELFGSLKSCTTVRTWKLRVHQSSCSMIATSSKTWNTFGKKMFDSWNALSLLRWYSTYYRYHLHSR